MCKIAMVAGARPNFIKLAPIVWACEKAKSEGKNIDFSLVYAGVENDPTLEPTLFDDLGIRRPDVWLGVDCESLNELTGKTMGEFDHYLDSTPTDVVIVVDDLASTMAVAIVCKKRGVKLAHLVAGTRSFDFSMPKEVNRLVIDGLSDLLFTAGAGAVSIANREGAEQKNVYMVGNIIIDTLRRNFSRFTRPEIMNEIGANDGEYIVLTINRKVLLADDDYLYRMLKALSESAKDCIVVAPLRESARKKIGPMVEGMANVHIVDSMDYLGFGYLTSHAKGIVTDSGNIAEEATFNNIACITLNEYTEHIETVNPGTNVLVGFDIEKLKDAVADMVDGKWKKAALPERWDGRTAERILQTIISC